MYRGVGQNMAVLFPENAEWIVPPSTGPDWYQRNEQLLTNAGITCKTFDEHQLAAFFCKAQQQQQPQAVRGVGDVRTYPTGVDPCYVSQATPFCPGESPSQPPLVEEGTPAPPPPEESPPPSTPSKMDVGSVAMWGGILLLVAGGGYVAYRATKKRR